MSTINLSREMADALYALSKRWRTPANSGFSHATFTALVKRGYAKTELDTNIKKAQRFDITEFGKDLAKRLPRYR